jgi:hypothetical protein
MGEVHGHKVPGFDYGNSPDEVSHVDFTGKTVIQRTSSGVQGILAASRAEEVLLGSFVLAEATVDYIKKKIPGVVSDRHQFNTYRRLGDSQAVLDQRPAASESLLRSLLHADEPRYHISGWIRLLENDPRLAISAVMGKAMPELQAQLNRQMQAAELRVRLTFVPPVPAPAPGALGISAVKDDVLVTVEYPDYIRLRIDTLRDFSIVVHAIAAATKLVSNADGPSFYSGPIWTSEPLTLSSEQSLSRRFSIPRDRIPNDQPVALLAELTYAKRPREGLAEQLKEWKQFYWTQPLLLSSGAPAEAATAPAPLTLSAGSGQASSGQATQPTQPAARSRRPAPRPCEQPFRQWG